MPKLVAPLTLTLAFLAGCATVKSEIEPEPEEPELSASFQSAVEKPPRIVSVPPPNPPEPSVDSRELAPPAPAEKKLGKERVQLVQELLRASGFYSGPIDGALGPRTLTALRQYHAGCATLKELLAGLEDEALLKSAGEPPKPAPRAARPRREEIRLVQERLKAAGFDPGPIDGVLGPKTRSALEQYQRSRGLAISGRPDAPTLLSLGI